MGDFKIWKYVGCVSAMSGLACFPLSSTYKMSFGKLGIGGLLSYLLVCLITWCLILLAKRNRVPEKVKGVVGAILFVSISSISVVHDKYVPGKSDAFTIISYGSFALMSLSLSRKLEVGFETGFSAFFLQLFAAQLFKIKWFLLPIALVFSSLVIILRHYPEESKVQEPGSITPNKDSNPIEVGPSNANANATAIRNGEEDIVFDLERQDSPELGEVSWQRQLSTNNKQNSQEESSQAIGEVSEENISDVGNELNSNQEEDGTRPSLAAESSYPAGQRHVSLIVPSSPPPQLERRRPTTRETAGQRLPSRTPSPEHPRRRTTMRRSPAIQIISSILGDTLQWWHPTHLFSFLVGGASFGVGLIYLAFSSIYDNSFGKLGSGGLLLYVGISLSIFYLIWGFKRIPVPGRIPSVVETILFVVICLISVELDKLVPGKSNALGIIWYGIFALMTVSMSRRFELGFETGFFTFFLSLFLEQLLKTNRKLSPIVLVFCLAAIRLHRRSQSGSPNGDRPQEVVPLINATAPAIDNHEYLDLEVLYRSGVGELEVSGESLSSTNNEQNNQEESSEATHHSPSNYGQVSVGNISDGGKKEEGSSSSSDNDLVDHCALPQPPRVKRRRRMTRAIRNISSSLGHTLRRWHPARLCFSKKIALKNKKE